MTTPALDDPVSTARRGLRVHRWTTVITTTGTGVVVVALASRLGVAAAVAAATASSAASARAVRHAVVGDHRWRRAMDIGGCPGAGDEER